jgi:pimeloyl-ACP methyl ester carboxylesterase
MEVERSTATLVAIPWRGHTIDAVLYHPTPRAEVAGRETPVVLRLHGMLGNLLDETEHFLPQRLADAGYESLAVNTLLANLGVFFGFGIFADCMAQIAAACDFIKRRGSTRMVIAGHGLGGSMAIHYAAACHDGLRDPALAGVIAVATPYSMPDAVQRRWRRFSSRPSYEEVRQRAERLFRSTPDTEPAGDEIVVVQQAHGDTLLPEHTEIYTLKTWWSLAGPEADGAKAHRYIGGIRAPILLVQGTQDAVIEPREGEDLGAVARSAGNPDVTEVFLAADHTFTGQHDALGDCIVRWLRDVVGNR